MKVTVVCPDVDQTIVLDVQSELTLADFRALCSIELKVTPPELLLFIFNGAPLTQHERTLGSHGIHDNDMILVQRGMPAQSQSFQYGGPPAQGTSRMDFSSIHVPGANRPQQPGPSQASLDMMNPEVLRQKFLSSPHDLALLNERNPVLAEALKKGGEAFATELEKIRQAQIQQEREKIRLLNADPMDPEVQNKIAEEIRQKNIQENMNMAIEESPESFGQVVMLWINVKVNGHCVKAFVDSGAQMTIMSASCAEKCSIMRLVDRRWEGIAKGVGTQKIIGRIHLAQMQIENDFLPCSFSVLEDQPMDVLLGLDMLRRHQCCIDLKNNQLQIGTTGTKTAFLQESELPLHGKLHDPKNNPETSAQLTEDERIARALKASAEEAMQREQDKSQTANHVFPGAGRSLKEGTATNLSPDVPSSQTGKNSSNFVTEAGLKQLMDMGFQRNVAESELIKCEGDAQRALLKLLASSLKTKQQMDK